MIGQTSARRPRRKGPKRVLQCLKETTCVAFLFLSRQIRQRAMSAFVEIPKTHCLCGCACNDEVTDKSNRTIRIRLRHRDPARRGWLVLSQYRRFEGQQRLGTTHSRGSEK